MESETEGRKWNNAIQNWRPWLEYRARRRPQMTCDDDLRIGDRTENGSEN